MERSKTSKAYLAVKQPVSQIWLYIADSEKHNVPTVTSAWKFIGKNSHTVNKSSRADFQEAGVEDWYLWRLPACTTSPVLLILKTLPLTGNNLLWIYSGVLDPVSTCPKAIPCTAGSPLNNTEYLFRVSKKKKAFAFCRSVLIFIDWM